MRKHKHVGIEDSNFPNEEYSFLKHPDIADSFKNRFPNESDILLNGWDGTEWCDWSHAYTTWVGYLTGYQTAKIGTIIINLKSIITPEAHEKLESALADFLSERRLSGSIDNLATGNTTVVEGE